MIGEFVMHEASTFVLLLAQLAVMAACGLAGGAVMRLLRQPAVLGEMLGGVVLGPTVFGALAPEQQAGLFPLAGDAAVLRNAAVKLGMLFFMFTVGLEINARGILKNGIGAVAIGLFGTLLPLAAGIGSVYMLPRLFGADVAADKFPLALFIGAAMANSANPVLARILLDLGLLKDRLGATIMAATVVDDLVSWTLLFVVFEQLKSGGESRIVSSGVAAELLVLAGFFALTLVCGWLASRCLAKWHARRPQHVAGRIGFLSVFVLLSAAAAEYLQIHAFLGPFLFGVALTPTESDAQDETYEAVRRFAHGFFVPIYFVSLGLTTDFAANFAPLLTAVVLIAACVSKIPAAYAGARLGGLGSSMSWAVGWGMNARGAIGIILANLGLEKGVIDQPTYVALVVMAIVTSLLAAPLMKHYMAAAASERKSTAALPARA